jgi:hypothetical protein
MITLPYTEAYIHRSSEITFYYILYYHHIRLSKRMNPDKSRNEYGFKLLKLCKSTGLRILNGRHGSGFANDYAHCGATSLSVIDYLISTIDLFNYFPVIQN